MPDTPIRDAATVILVREDGSGPRVLMGQRGSGAAFMASKFVFPGGALDPADLALARDLAGRTGPAPADEVRLAAEPRPESPDGIGPGLAMAAVRETWEETGLAIARPLDGAAPGSDDPSWSRFLAAGHMPAPDRLRFVFRAITPAGRPRRFDARFFLARADAIASPLDDFSGAEDELSHLSWVPLAEARALDLPFITEVVLAEVADIVASPGGSGDRPVPFFRHADSRSYLAAL